MRVSRLFATVSAMGLLTGSLLVGGVHADSANVPAITVGAPPGGAFLGGERADVVSSPTTADYQRIHSAKLRAPRVFLPGTVRTRMMTKVLMNGQAVGSRFAAAASVPYAKSLAVVQVAQEKSNWCGPAAAYMLLKFKGKTVSAYDGRATLSQAGLAGPKYTNAGVSGGTDFIDREMETALNRWYGSGWGFYQVLVESEKGEFPANFLWDDLYMNIYNGMPVVFDMVEISGGKHYNNHPRSRNIFHWTTAFGISNKVDPAGVISIADPAANSAAVGWQGLSRTFTMTTTLAVDHMNEGGNVRGFVF